MGFDSEGLDRLGGVGDVNMDVLEPFEGLKPFFEGLDVVCVYLGSGPVELCHNRQSAETHFESGGAGRSHEKFYLPSIFA